jgi:hypothetical protein
MKETAFTSKPDLSQFIKATRHAHHAQVQGKKAKDNPTPDQKLALHAPIKKGKK